MCKALHTSWLNAQGQSQAHITQDDKYSLNAWFQTTVQGCGAQPLVAVAGSLTAACRNLPLLSYDRGTSISYPPCRYS